VGNDEKYFGSGDRFSSVNVGISLPILTFGQRAKIRANNVMVQQREKELEAAKQQYQTELFQAINTYDRNRELLGTYQSVLLKNSATVIEAANKRFQSGDTGYLEWVILVNQALDMRSSYFNVIEQLNQSAITVEKLSGVN
jgi:cobalt-zinc-cadmium resistance protein CzcA